MLHALWFKLFAPPAEASMGKVDPNLPPVLSKGAATNLVLKLWSYASSTPDVLGSLYNISLATKSFFSSLVIIPSSPFHCFFPCCSTSSLHTTWQQWYAASHKYMQAGNCFP